MVLGELQFFRGCVNRIGQINSLRVCSSSLLLLSHSQPLPPHTSTSLILSHSIRSFTYTPPTLQPPLRER